MSLAPLIHESNTAPRTMHPMTRAVGGTSASEARVTTNRISDQFFDGPVMLSKHSPESGKGGKSVKIGGAVAIAVGADCENQKPSKSTKSSARRSMETPRTLPQSANDPLRASWHCSPLTSKSSKRVTIVADKQKREALLAAGGVVSSMRVSSLMTDQPIASPWRDPRKAKSLRNLLSEGAPKTCSPRLSGRDRILTTKPPVQLPDLISGGDCENTKDVIESLPLGSASDHGVKYNNRQQHPRQAPVLESLCSILPKTKSESQNFVIKGNSDSQCTAETPEGETLLTLDSNGTAGSLSSSFTSGVSKSKSNKDRRYVRDCQGELAAVIIHSMDDQSTHRYKICSGNPAYPGQRRSPGINLYTWADVKNSTSGRGLQYSMKLRSPGGEKYVSEHFGPSLFKWDTPRGFTIRKDPPANNEDQQAKEQKPSARVAYMGGARGLVVAPRADPCLMYCFVTIIDEMVEKRQR